MDDLLNDFIEECVDIFAKTNSLLQELNSRPQQSDDVNALFRWIHTIKGGAGMMGFPHAMETAHTLENYLAESQKNATTVDIAKIQKYVDSIEELLFSKDSGDEGATPVHEEHHEAVEPVADVYNYFKQTIFFSEFYQSFPDLVDMFFNQKQLCFELAIDKAQGKALVSKFEKLKLEIVSKEEKDDKEIMLITFSLDRLKTFQPLLDKLSQYPNFHWLLSPVSLKAEKVEKKEVAQSVPKKINEAESASSQNKKNNDTSSAGHAEASEVVRVPLHRVNESLNGIWEIFLFKNQLSYLFEQNKAFLRSRGELWQEIEKLDNSLSRGIAEIESNLMGMRMSSIKSLFSRMEKAVRQYVSTSGKEIELSILGSEVEADKKLLDILGEPMIHMIRNAMDHGIEPSDKRVEVGKSPKGLIKISAETTSDKLIIEISDDGKGINKEFIISKALSKGLIKVAPETDQDVYLLLFLPGFSTAEKITEVSGRGVGMDVVKKTIDSLGGEIKINSTLGQGTTFHIELPLSMSLVSAVLVEVNSQSYAFGINNLLEVLSTEDIVFTNNLDEKVFSYRDQFIPCYDLRDVFHKDAHRNPGRITMVFEMADGPVGFIVDKVVKHTEIVVKEITALFQKIPEVVGVSILATGAPVFVLSSEKIRKKCYGKKGIGHVI